MKNVFFILDLFNLVVFLYNCQYGAGVFYISLASVIPSSFRRLRRPLLSELTLKKLY